MTPGLIHRLAAVTPMLATAAALSVTGCRSDESPTPPTPSSTVELVLPSLSGSSHIERTPAWLDELPAVALDLEPGTKVWASVPQLGSKLVRVGVYNLEGVYDGKASLTDRLGQRVDGIAGALVHRAEPAGKLEEGQLVLCYAWTLPAMLARVAKLSAGSEIEVLYDWAGTTKKQAIEHAQVPVTGIAPMAYVSFPKAGSQSRGLVLALSDDKAWVRNASGHVETTARAALKELPLPPDELAVGRAVLAFRWATGFVDATISEVLEPGLRYRVRFAGDKPAEEFFFTALVAK